MARPLKPLVKSGGYLPSKKWTPLVYNGGYTTMDGGEEPVPPPPPINWKTITGVSPLALVNAIAHSIKSLTQYGKMEQRNIPAEYTELDYIESTGTQYINTGLGVTENTRAKVTFAFTSTTASTRRVFGKIAGSSTSAFSFREYTSFYWFGSNSITAGTDTNKHTVDFRTDGKVYKDDVQIGVKGTFGGASTGNVYLFAELSDGGNINYGSVRIYSYTQYDGNDVVLNLIPAKRNSDNALGMYDTVSGSFFENAGTGNFTAGSAAVPTPSAPMDLWCNNGRLAFGKPLTLDPTRYYAYIGTSNTWSYSTDSYSIVIPVTVGKKYKITADPTTPIDGSVVNVILRWGFVDTVYDIWKQSAVVPSSTSVTIYDWVRSTPQDTQSVEVTATHPFMVIQMGAAAFASNLTNGRIGVAVQEIYTDGTPEVLTVQGKNLLDLGSKTFERAATFDISGIPAGDYVLSAVVTSDDTDFTTCRVVFRGADGTNNAVIQMPRSTGGERVSMTLSLTVTATSILLYASKDNNSSQGDTATFADIQLELGSTATAYQPYVTPQTVNDIPMLLGVGDYKDTEELIAGIKTGKVGVKVLDGTETFTWSNTYNCPVISSAVSAWGAVPSSVPMCTHYVGTTVGTLANGKCCFNEYHFYIKDSGIASADDIPLLTAFLAAQYAAGTPVIILYPLATETTEQTTAHALNSYEGTTVVDATTNVDPVTIKVEYASSEE